MTRRRTDAEATADVVAVVLHFHFMSADYTAQLLDLLGITHDDLGAAQDRLAERGHQPWRPPGMTVDRQPRSRRRQERVTEDLTTELECVGTEGHPPHWAPEDEFAPRADRPGHRQSMCHEGRRQYKRLRHVTAAVLTDLRQVGLEFTLDADSDMVGLTCVSCGHPLAEGDTVHVNGNPLHAECDQHRG